ncbi:uncharacterized protein BT62DRAFT_589449 [Guyanagaster necrorhizus]|uniref:Uncharacterized protein n=1 Tax=Guyanagaster necrorhizus TaxID=856835 RepID=A0A9P7VXS8_9AGAR|nr:uncharacterized protein BT62DRAFT_589449 [Guyanagaster necrorhizus MCA 3950]KAG7449521.1 hypothetical protein BT62DRAFT_589449 [Guyanagaster necrorhizus MCA 3950]
MELATGSVRSSPRRPHSPVSMFALADNGFPKQPKPLARIEKKAKSPSTPSRNSDAASVRSAAPSLSTTASLSPPKSISNLWRTLRCIRRKKSPSLPQPQEGPDDVFIRRPYTSYVDKATQTPVDGVRAELELQVSIATPPRGKTPEPWLAHAAPSMNSRPSERSPSMSSLVSRNTQDDIRRSISEVSPRHLLPPDAPFNQYSSLHPIHPTNIVRPSSPKAVAPSQATISFSLPSTPSRKREVDIDVAIPETTFSAKPRRPGKIKRPKTAPHSPLSMQRSSEDRHFFFSHRPDTPFIKSTVYFDEMDLKTIKERREDWSGEWNTHDMQEVMRRLRDLR